MLRQKQPVYFHFLTTQEFDSKNDQAKNKDQQAETVNAMHIADPFTLRTAWIFLFKIEIFGNLIPDTHNNVN